MAGGQLKSYNFSRGINRTFSQLELPEGFVRDAYNLLPRVPGGAQAVAGDVDLAALPISGGICDDLFPFYYGASSFYWIARVSGGTAPGIYYSAGTGSPWTWTLLTGVTVGSGTHSLSVYRGLLVIAEEGYTLKTWDGSAAITSLTAGPFGGLATEYMGRLCCMGESVAPTLPQITVPLCGTGIPLMPLSKQCSGNLTGITAGVCATTDTITAAAVGDFAILGGSSAYRITAITPGTSFTVTPIDESPADTSSSVAFTIYRGDLLQPYPSGTVDLGQSTLNTDSGSMAIRLHNRSFQPVRIVDVRVKGADFRVDELAPLPVTIPPSGSMVFKVIMNPFSTGVLNGNVLVEHDLFAQSSVNIPLTGEGVTSAVVVSPSCLDFGEWLENTASAPIKVQIKNTLREPITISAWTGPSSPFTISGTAPAANDIILPGKTLEFGVIYTPTKRDATETGHFHISRTTPVKAARLRMSKPLDCTQWNHDTDWIDIEQADSFTGKPVGLWNYDDALLIFKESEIGSVIAGGEMEFMYRQITLGKGIGAMCQQSICSGNGAVFWVAKTGVYKLTAQTVEPIHIPIDDVISAIASSDYATARAAFYDGYFIFTATLPTGFLGDSVDKALWAYYDPGQSWWRLAGDATALAVRRGVADKPALYAATSGRIYCKDSALSSTTAFSISPGYTAAGEPGVVKHLEYAIIHTDDSAQFANGCLEVRSDNGDVVKGVVEGNTTTVLACGVGVATAGVLTDTEQAFTVDALIGKSLTANGVAYPITANTATVMTATNLPASGKCSYVVSGSNPGAVLPVPVYLRECFGGAFNLALSGTKTAAGLGNIYGIILNIAPVHGRVGQPGRV